MVCHSIPLFSSLHSAIICEYNKIFNIFHFESNIIAFLFYSGIILEKERNKFVMNRDKSRDKNKDENKDENKDILKKSQSISRWGAQKIFYCVSRRFKRSWSVKRGEVYFVDLGENVGSEENKIRPVVVLQSNAYNFKSPVFTCAIISTSPMTIPDIQVPLTGTYPYIDNKKRKKNLTGTVDLGQIKTIGKERIVSVKICTLSEMNEVNLKIFNVLGLGSVINAKDNTIKSLEGKVEYLNKKLKEMEK